MHYSLIHWLIVALVLASWVATWLFLVRKFRGGR